MLERYSKVEVWPTLMNISWGQLNEIGRFHFQSFGWKWIQKLLNFIELDQSGRKNAADLFYANFQTENRKKIGAIFCQKFRLILAKGQEQLTLATTTTTASLKGFAA